MWNRRAWFAVTLLVTASSFAQDDEDELPPGLLAKYVAGDTTIERIDPAIAFVWNEAAPDERLPAGSFSAMWTGRVLLRGEKGYRWHAFVQGKVQLKIGDRVALTGASDKPRWLSGEAGEYGFGEQPFELTFARTEDAAQLKLYWSSAEFPLEPVPSFVFFHDKSRPDLSLVERGRVQFESHRCANCHGEIREPEKRLSSVAAPSLKHVGIGTSRDWLVENLMRTSRPAASEMPSGSHQKMPAFGFSREDAEAVVATLLNKSAPVELLSVGKTKDLERDKELQVGRTLIRSVGCLACHTWDNLGEAAPFGGGSLSDIAQKRSAAWLTTWLADPAKLNPEHRMPVVSLSEKERTQIVLALQSPLAPAGTAASVVRGEGSGARDEGTGKPDAAVLARGEKLIESARCAACHELSGTRPNVAVPRSLARADVDWSKSCTLSPDRAIHQPGFPHLDSKAIQAYVASWRGRAPSSLAFNPPPSTLNQSDLGRRLLEQKNCLACHDRDESRGLSRLAASVAKADESLAGLHMTLIPPRLHAVGDRMRDTALAEAIQGAPKAPRLSWLRVRMPRFQHTPVEQAALLAHLIGHDRIPDHAPALPAYPLASEKPDPQRLLAGRELLGGKGFSCVACHAVKDYTPKVTALGTRGSNLHLLGQRMRTDYYFRWTRAPLRIMPGVEMPNYQRPHAVILPGQLDQQLTAIWEALNDPSLTSPTNPAVVEQLLTVNKGAPPEIVRDLFTVPGAAEESVARAFAVGFDNGHSVLFDLDTGGIRAWTLGDFARQRCEGKRWYWDLAGTVLATRFDKRPEILFVNTNTGDVLAPETGWQFDLELVSHARFDIRCRLIVSQGAQSYSADVAETWRTMSEPSGWERTIAVFHLEETPLMPWYRGAVPETVHGTASIIVDAPETERPRDVPATARPFRLVGGSDKNLVANTPELKIRYTSSLHRVEAASPSPLTPPLVSSADRITSIPGFRGQRLPLPRSIMPTAITFDDRQRPLFTSLKGHLYRIDPVSAENGRVTLTTLTNGLAAPFGVLWRPGIENARPFVPPAVFVAHKPELLELPIADDSVVGYRRVVAAGWGVSEDYHDWTCGIARDSRQNLFIGLGSDYTFKNRPKEKSRWRGDILRIGRDGTIESIARGLRYPTGLAIDDQDRLFVSDQQGVQNTFNELNYIQPGHRYGVPSRHEPEPNAPADPPAVQIPHPWTRSVNGIVFVPKQRREKRDESREPEKRRDSLAGHFLGCEYNNNMLVRMSIQTVGDAVQGAVYPFSKPTSEIAPQSASPTGQKDPSAVQDSSSLIGPMCIGISPSGDVYVGGFLDGGWAGGLNMGDIVKLTPEGDLLNGIREIRATSRGFDIEFFHAVDAKLAAQTSQYKISGYTRVWKGDYATPDSGRHTGEVQAAKLSQDGRTASLTVQGLKPGHIYDVSVDEIGVESQRTLWPAIGHYTLHHVPR